MKGSNKQAFFVCDKRGACFARRLDGKCGILTSPYESKCKFQKEHREDREEERLADVNQIEGILGRP